MSAVNRLCESDSLYKDKDVLMLGRLLRFRLCKCIFLTEASLLVFFKFT